MLWEHEKEEVDPVAYAAKVRKDAEKMQAMSEAFGTHEKLPSEKTNRTAPRKTKQDSQPYQP